MKTNMRHKKITGPMKAGLVKWDELTDTDIIEILNASKWNTRYDDELAGCSWYRDAMADWLIEKTRRYIDSKHRMYRDCAMRHVIPWCEKKYAEFKVRKREFYQLK